MNSVIIALAGLLWLVLACRFYGRWSGASRAKKPDHVLAAASGLLLALAALVVCPGLSVLQRLERRVG